MKIVKEKFDLPFEAYAVYDCPIRHPLASRMENHADWLFVNRSDRDRGSLYITAWTWTAEGSLEEHAVAIDDDVGSKNFLFKKNTFELASWVHEQVEDLLGKRSALDKEWSGHVKVWWTNADGSACMEVEDFPYGADEEDIEAAIKDFWTQAEEAGETLAGYRDGKFSAEEDGVPVW